MSTSTSSNESYPVKNFGGKKVWRIKTIKVWQKNIGELKSICIAGDCYSNGENWQENLANCCNSPNLPKVFTATVQYAFLGPWGSFNKSVYMCYDTSTQVHKGVLLSTS